MAVGEVCGGAAVTELKWQPVSVAEQDINVSCIYEVLVSIVAELKG
jgi:hypothetical protein